MEEMADTLGLEVMVTLLFLKEPFLLFHCYTVWAQLRVLHGKYVNQILHSLNLKMYYVLSMYHPRGGTARSGSWTLGVSTGQAGGLQVCCSTSAASHVDR